MKNVIVTGANGFIGSSLVKKLVMNHVRVVAVDLSFAKSKLPKSEFVTKIEIGSNNIEGLQDQIPTGEYDAFYHLAWAGVNGYAKADPIIQLKNAEMVMNCSKIAKSIGCKKIMCAGTIAEQVTNSLKNLDKTNGGMIYGVAKKCTHLMLDTYCKNIGLDFIWMQFSNIYGPDNQTGNLISYTIDQLTNGKEAEFGPALQPYDFIYIEDLIEAVYRLGDKKTSKNFYFIGSGESRFLKDYLLEIGDIYGKPELIKIGVRPDDGVLYTDDMFDIEPLKKDIGNYISKSFSDGIKYTIENYRV